MRQARSVNVDTLTTIKYAVGLENASVTVDNVPLVPLLKAGGVTFVNRAKSGWFVPDYTAKNFSVEVINSGGIPLVQVGNLPQTLAPGSSQNATLMVWGAVPRPSPYPIQIRISYSTIDGEVCSKDCGIIDVMVV